ncbi:MAG TPA: hypothetical protein VLG49_05185 [Rhabdochlamydiaceae bacterium]|nr:hypothetical protein [Rhabdochlamydiaceae bacterium]
MAFTTTIHHSAGKTIRTTTFHKTAFQPDAKMDMSDTDCKVAKACVSPSGALGYVALAGAVIKAPKIFLPVTASVGFLVGGTYFMMQKFADLFAALGDFENQKLKYHRSP